MATRLINERTGLPERRTLPLWVSLMSLSGVLGINLWFQLHPIAPKVLVVEKHDGAKGRICQIGPWPAGSAELTLDEAALSKGMTSDELLTHIAMGRLKPAYRTWQGTGYSIPGDFTLDLPRTPIPPAK